MATGEDSELMSGAGSGTGIANVLGRLAALYHGRAALRFESNEPHGVIAVMTLPGDSHAHRPAG
jgi:hypothetical protein